jgi:hypothetical protein
MSHKVVLIVALLLSFSISIPPRVVAMPTGVQTILPEDCMVLAGKELTLTLDGAIPPNTTVSWAVTHGTIVSVLPGVNALFIAPSKPMIVTISIFLSPALSSRNTPLTRQCVVTSPNSAPRGMA